MTDLEVDSDQPVKRSPTEYFRAAARFRALEAEATTPRIKRYLRALIHECERLAGKAEEAGGSFKCLIRESRN
jgi:hypothetical protein